MMKAEGRWGVVAVGCIFSLALASCEADERIKGGWKLESMVVRGEEVAIPEGLEVKLEFGEKSRVSGFSGVNRFHGDGKVDGRGKVIWGKAFATTRRGGPKEWMDFERKFLGALREVERFSTGGRLIGTRGVDGRGVKLIFVKEG